jgi:hypothetical protein
MKSKKQELVSVYLISILVVAAFYLTGCSSKYTIRDFPTKDKFIEYFNKSIKDKPVKITLQNDSSFSNVDGVVVENDTLLSYGEVESREKGYSALSDIAEIKYISNDYTSASVLLKNGDKIRGENIRINRDSMYYVNIKTLIARNNIAQIDKVKTVIYKNRLIRIPLGLLMGAPLGFLAGGMLGTAFHTTDEKGLPDVLNITFEMTILGGFVGMVTSSLVGYDYIYQFNP